MRHTGLCQLLHVILWLISRRNWILFQCFAQLSYLGFWIKFRNGVQNRRNSYEDGVFGTTCPIPPGKNFTYILQVKDQIGSFYYYPSLAFHKAAGGFGGIRILSRPLIPVPFDEPAGDYTVLIGDWYKSNHTVSFPFFIFLLIYLFSYINHDFLLWISGYGPIDFVLFVAKEWTVSKEDFLVLLLVCWCR